LGASVALPPVGLRFLNFPDPGLALDSSNGCEVWYAFSTQTGDINVQLASSPDFSRGHCMKDMMLPHLAKLGA